MVLNQFGPCIIGSTQPVPLDKLSILGTFVQRDQISWGPFVHGDQIFGDHLSMGTELVGGLFVHRNQSIGDQLWGTKCPGTI